MPLSTRQAVLSFVVVGLILTFALAYNLAGTSEGNKALRTAVGIRNRIQSVRERLDLCLANLKEAEKGQGNSSTTLERLKKTNTLLISENAMLKDTNTKDRRAILDCREDLSSEREKRTGTRNLNATAEIEQLKLQQKQLDAAVKEANVTKELRRVEIKHLIAAYQIENKKMQADIVVLGSILTTTTEAPAATNATTNTTGVGTTPSAAVLTTSQPTMSDDERLIEAARTTLPPAGDS